MASNSSQPHPSTVTSETKSHDRFPLVYEDTRGANANVAKSAPYRNPWHNGAFALPSPLAMMSFLSRFWSLGAAVFNGQVDVSKLFPKLPLDAKRLGSPPRDLVQVTWIGHASCLVQMNGIAFLTDPVFAERASFVSFAGPKRYVETPFSLDELLQAVKIDFVCISHNHYDHLDFAVVDKLRNSVRWIVPTGIGAWMRKAGIGLTNVVELDWWQAAKLSLLDATNGPVSVVDVRKGPAEHLADDSLLVACTPAQHWSTRGLFDRFATLWASWSVISVNNRVHFCGDTGHNAVFCGADTYGTADGHVFTSADFAPAPQADAASASASAPAAPVAEARTDERLLTSHFAEVGDVLGPFDLALIPIGAYEPRPVMRAQHICPEEAVAAHVQLRAKKSLGVHFGTFVLTTEPVDEPPVRVRKEMERLGLDPLDFFTIKHGETRIVGDGETHVVKRRVKHHGAAVSSTSTSTAHHNDEE
jgi:N-acyl-phosphatidylethanolamine-hydrolysing phospholipase D